MRLFNLTKYLLILSFFFVSAVSQADAFLPLQTLRDQGSTDHCWAYSMTHVLESRALVRDSNRVLINIEKDIKYWVDYERMMYIYRTKGSFYLGEYEGGWQIEYFEALLKHGKSIYSNARVSPDINYPPLQEFDLALKFMPEPRPRPNGSLPSWDSVSNMMRNRFTSEKEAHDFAIDYLNKLYGTPQAATKWDGRMAPVTNTAKLILGSDYMVANSVDSLVLVKPTTDGNHGWTKYLQGRYWGYRYDKAQILNLIEQSLNNKWPVTFDNVFHALTIIAYTTASNGSKHFAIANSIPGKITWLKDDELLSQLNFVTFFRVAIPNALPPKDSGHMLNMWLPMSSFGLDQYDRVSYPPR